MPECECHGEPSYWQKDTRYNGDGYWYCAERARERSRRNYDAMSGVALNLKLLQARRRKALARRHLRQEERSGEVQTKG